LNKIKEKTKGDRGFRGMVKKKGKQRGFGDLLGAGTDFRLLRGWERPEGKKSKGKDPDREGGIVTALSVLYPSHKKGDGGNAKMSVREPKSEETVPFWLSVLAIRGGGYLVGRWI